MHDFLPMMASSFFFMVFGRAPLTYGGVVCLRGSRFRRGCASVRPPPSPPASSFSGGLPGGIVGGIYGDTRQERKRREEFAEGKLIQVRLLYVVGANTIAAVSISYSLFWSSILSRSVAAWSMHLGGACHSPYGRKQRARRRSVI